MLHPHVGRVGGIGLREDELVLAVLEEQLRLPVAIDVLQQAEFAREVVRDGELLPPARFSARIDVEHDRPREEHVDDVRPAVAREVVRELQAVEVLGAGVDRLRKIDLARGRVVRAEVVVRTRHDVGHVVVIDVGDRWTPGVVELVQGLHPEVRRHLLRKRDARLEVLVANLLEADFASSTGVERNRSELSVLVIRHAAAHAADVVQEGAQNIRIEDHFNRVPIIRPQVGARSRDRSRRGRRTTARAWTAPARSATRGRAASGCGSSGRRGRWWRSRSNLSGRTRPEPLARRFVSLRVERHTVRDEVTFCERHEDALQSAVRGFLRSEEQPGPAAGRTAEGRCESDVLIASIQYEPATAHSLESR